MLLISREYHLAVYQASDFVNFHFGSGDNLWPLTLTKDTDLKAALGLERLGPLKQPVSAVAAAITIMV